MNFAQFQKPQRYIGNEWNVIKKSHPDKIKICIAFPDLYEIGMSNLGIRIIYGLLNEYPDVVCERAFMPGLDLAEYLKSEEKKLFTLESKSPLDEFEVLGFNLGFELNYTNFLSMLELSKIPLFADKRENVIVLGGGIANPEPLAQFTDVFFMGEFEEISDKFINVLRKFKDKNARLNALSKLEGFYVPSFYDVSLNDNAYVFNKNESNANFPIKRVYVKDLDKSFYPLNWLTPHTQITQDRVPIEIARGCPNRCTFCQARSFYFPYRQRKTSTIKHMVKKIYDNTGYENFSFLSLSASDHSSIKDIISDSYEYCDARRIGLALPSLRVDDILGELNEQLARLKKTSITVAVEAATNRLRETLNKKIDISKLFEAAKLIRSLNIKHIKLYFMFGFPDESAEDLHAIGQFLNILRKNSKLSLNVSINVFIPKPYSLWEGVKMEEESILESKKQIILKSLPKTRNIKVSISNIRKSILEGIVSRADRKFASVIYRAFLKGARFDGSKENFSWKIWDESMLEEGINYTQYLNYKTKNFPWSFIKTNSGCSETSKKSNNVSK